MLPELLEPLASLTILIVEDDPVALEMLRVPLEKKCRRILTCTKGEIGLKTFKAEPIDIIIADINLEGKMDGISMVQSIRKTNTIVPAIFMTAYSDEEKLEEVIKLNAVSFIKKPVDLDELFVLLLNLNKQIQKEQMYDLGHGVFYRRRDKCILKGYAVFELTDRESSILELLIEANGHLSYIKNLIKRFGKAKV